MHVHRATTADELAACLRLRRTVFIEEQGVPEADELDELDGVCRHFLATPSVTSRPDEAIGTARLLFLAADTAKAQRVAVLAAHRGQGVGAALMFALEGEAARAGATTLMLASQLSAARFYERLGYRAEGEVFVDAGIDHVVMKKSIG
ncbi:MAG: GNAT family N-acetyltransferase [Deltaproteobacteria bacterium]|nr:GNAT family N-acetyltransferase [Deltaproteobacteria bacterium]